MDPVATTRSKVFTRLAHLAALSKTERLAGAVDNLVLATLDIEPSLVGGTTDELTGALEDWWGLRLPGSQVDEALARLRRARKLLREGDDTWRLDPEVAAQLAERANDSRLLEDRVRG